MFVGGINKLLNSERCIEVKWARKGQGVKRKRGHGRARIEERERGMGHCHCGETDGCKAGEAERDAKSEAWKAGGVGLKQGDARSELPLRCWSTTRSSR